uniref:N/A n=1 Tax=Ganoderma boninense TaxID=34458 RepID=A0A5K1K278_9APHY|nr:N/A [Ganoderma boninense]
MSAPAEFLKYIDDNADRFIDRLAAAVAIPSVSGDADRRPDVVNMAKWLDQQLQDLSVTTKLVDLGDQKKSDEKLHLPPAVLGRIGEDPKKKTVLVYGHYDVQPVSLYFHPVARYRPEDLVDFYWPVGLEHGSIHAAHAHEAALGLLLVMYNQSYGWSSDPFELVVEDTGRLVGRGSTDDKGPIMGWLNVLEAHKALGRELPVNMRFCFAGMEESGSEGLDDLIKSESAKGKDGWFDGVDCVCISDNYWLNTRTPCLTYGLRGIVYFSVNVTGPKQDLHSGMFGRMVHEPMTDLIALMGKLVAPDGTILVPGVDALVPALTDKEREMYENIDYSVQDLEQSAPGAIALSDDKVTLLMGRMRMPSLSLHGIEGAFSGSGSKTIIPASVSGKFSIRIVNPQTPELIELLVRAHLQKEFAKLESKNTLTITNIGDGMPWVTDPEDPNYEAASRATKARPFLPFSLSYSYLTREGGSIPVTLTFADSLGVNVLLLPMGRGDDGAHSTNEKLDRSNFIEGSKLLGTYLYELGPKE